MHEAYLRGGGLPRRRNLHRKKSDIAWLKKECVSEEGGLLPEGRGRVKSSPIVHLRLGGGYRGDPQSQDKPRSTISPAKSEAGAILQGAIAKDFSPIFGRRKALFGEERTASQIRDKMLRDLFLRTRGKEEMRDVCNSRKAPCILSHRGVPVRQAGPRSSV